MGLVINRGHGALGLRDRLKDFVQLIDTSASEKTVIVELQPVQEVTGWAPDQNGAFVSAVDFSFDGVRVDIIDVRSLIDATLERVETVEEVRAREGTFFYDPEQEFGPTGLWDDGVTEWDDGITRWDQFTQLFVHLTGGVDPDETTIVAVHSFGFAPKGLVQPQFGPEKLLNGGFEDFTGGKADDWDTLEDTGFIEWDSVGPLWDDSVTLWDESLAALFQNTENFREGDSSICMDVDSSNVLSIGQSLNDAFTIRKTYRFYGAYFTEGDVTAQIAITDVPPTAIFSMLENGRDKIANVVYIPLRATGGEWRRFSIDFVAHAEDLRFILRAIAGAGSGQVCWDDVNVRRVWSYNFFEPRVEPSAIPETRTGSHDAFFGRKNIGVGSINLVNANDYFYELVPELEWGNQNALVFFGGEFPPGHPDDISQEILLEDFERAFSGLMQDVSTEDESFTTDIQDLRSFFHSTIPINLYDVGQQASLSLSPNLQGNPRPVFFGEKENINPGRISFAANDYGIYEIADTSDAPAGIFSIDQVFAYLDDTAANERRIDSRLLLIEGTDYVTDLPNGQFSIINDVGPFFIDDTNNKMDFNDGAVVVATLTPGLYTATGLAAEVDAQMSAVSSQSILVTYDQTTHLFRIASSGATILLIKTGVNAELGTWKTLGYNPSTDTPNVAAHVADNPVFEDADADNFLRTDAKGFEDDAQGTFTGIPESLINIGADVLRVILIKYMKKAANIIDEDSFTEARTLAPEEVSIYLNKPTSTKDIFDRLEFSNGANIIVDADGIVSYRVDVTAVGTNVPIVDDNDIEVFEGGFDISDVYQTIRILYDKDPSQGNFQAVEATDPGVIIRLGRPDIREFVTFLKRIDDARERANIFLALARESPRRLVVNLLGGRYIRLEVGDKINLSRVSALGIDGTIQDEIFRIISIRKKPTTGKVNMELVDNIPGN